MHSEMIEAYPEGCSPAYLANGVVGLRLPKFAIVGAAATLCGYVGVNPTEHVEAWVHLPYPLAMDVRIDGRRLSHRPDGARFIRQTLDFSCGEAVTEFAFTVDAVTATIRVLTFCSGTHPMVVAQELQLQVDRPCELVLCVGIAGAGVPGRCVEHRIRPGGDRARAEACILWSASGDRSNCGLAYCGELHGAAGVTRPETRMHDGDLTSEYTFHAAPGTRYTLRQITSLVPGILHPEPHNQAVRLALQALDLGFDALREHNRNAWRELWRGCPQLIGAPQRHQKLINAAFYYLHTSVHASSPASVGLLGLSLWKNYHYFNGHAFWDLETFCLPVLSLTQPHAAAALLAYRYRGLPAARHNAAMNGYHGAQYPWESSNHGYEVLPLGYAHLVREQHVTADIAIAMFRHVCATGDMLFARERAWPVVSAAADWVESRVVHTSRGAEIQHACGIDEGRHDVNNSAWTNATCATALRYAVRLAAMLGIPARPGWSAVAEAMYLPHVDGVLQNFDGMPREGPICPDSLAVLWPLGYPLRADAYRNTLVHYLNRRDGYIGYPMLSIPYFVWGALTQDRILSRELFEQGVESFFFDPFLQVDEFGTQIRPAKQFVGPYLAHAGGLLGGVLLGLTGIVTDDPEHRNWMHRPICLPQGWDAIHAEQLFVQGQPASLVAAHGDARATLQLRNT